MTNESAAGVHWKLVIGHWSLRFKAASALALTLILTTALSSCRQIPRDVLEPGAGDEAQYAVLIEQARAAFAADPRSVAHVERSAALFAEAFAIRSDDYDALWQAARAAAWLGEYGEHERERHVRDGITYANTALQLRPDGVEATFYHGVLAGMLADISRSYGLDAVRQIERRMTALIEAGADVAHGGPQRVYGVLLMRAPGPPTSIGSLRNARRQLEAAVEIAPEWPENHLYLAEWELAWAKDRDRPEFADQARQRLNEQLLNAQAPAGYAYEFSVWQAKARALLAKD
jgi:hypothetical protein